MFRIVFTYVALVPLFSTRDGSLRMSPHDSLADIVVPLVTGSRWIKWQGGEAVDVIDGSSEIYIRFFRGRPRLFRCGGRFDSDKSFGATRVVESLDFLFEDSPDSA